MGREGGKEKQGNHAVCGSGQNQTDCGSDHSEHRGRGGEGTDDPNRKRAAMRQPLLLLMCLTPAFVP